MAAITHLSGLAGYIIPLGGVVVPIVIWVVRKDSNLISSLAKQAVLLNFIVFVLLCFAWILAITIILIPAVILFTVLLMGAALILPIAGALKANQGIYYRYPVVGVEPN